MGLFNKILSLLKKPKDFYSGGMSFEEEEEYLDKYGTKVSARQMNEVYSSIIKSINTRIDT